MTARRRRGANAVEFALLMPVFALILFGLVDYSWLGFHVQGVKTAVQSGCRSSSTVDPGLNERDIGVVLVTARNKVLAAYQQAGGNCTDCQVTATALGALPNRSVQCTLSVPFASLTGFVPVPTRVQATVVTRLEYQRRQQ